MAIAEVEAVAGRLDASLQRCWKAFASSAESRQESCQELQGKACHLQLNIIHLRTSDLCSWGRHNARYILKMGPLTSGLTANPSSGHSYEYFDCNFGSEDKEILATPEAMRLAV